jgi:hypothetical protein
MNNLVWSIVFIFLSISNCSEMPLNCMQNWETSAVIREALIRASKKLRVYICCMGSVSRNYLVISFFSFFSIGFEKGCKPFYNNSNVLNTVPRITTNTLFFFNIIVLTHISIIYKKVSNIYPYKMGCIKCTRKR